MNEQFKANEFSNEPTRNYTAHSEAMLRLSIADIIRAVDYINMLSQFIDSDNEALDDMENVLEPMNMAIEILRTQETCKYCGSSLYKSDLPQYDYVCPDCDENF